MHDPYMPPNSPLATPAAHSPAVAKGVGGKRILLGAVVLYLVLTAWAILSMFLTLTITSWLDTSAVSVEVIMGVRIAIHFLVATAAYWWFAAGVRRGRLLHVLLTWTLVQILHAIVVMFAVQVEPHRLAWQPLLFDLLTALAGWGLTWLWPGRHVRIAHHSS